MIFPQSIKAFGLAHLMGEQRPCDLVVTDSVSDRPTAILSALDIAAMVEWAED